MENSNAKKSGPSFPVQPTKTVLNAVTAVVCVACLAQFAFHRLKAAEISRAESEINHLVAAEKARIRNWTDKDANVTEQERSARLTGQVLPELRKARDHYADVLKTAGLSETQRADQMKPISEWDLQLQHDVALIEASLIHQRFVADVNKYLAAVHGKGHSDSELRAIAEQMSANVSALSEARSKLGSLMASDDPSYETQFKRYQNAALVLSSHSLNVEVQARVAAAKTDPTKVKDFANLTLQANSRAPASLNPGFMKKYSTFEAARNQAVDELRVDGDGKDRRKFNAAMKRFQDVEDGALAKALNEEVELQRRLAQ